MVIQPDKLPRNTNNGKPTTKYAKANIIKIVNSVLIKIITHTKTMNALKNVEIFIWPFLLFVFIKSILLTRFLEQNIQQPVNTVIELRSIDDNMIIKRCLSLLAVSL